MNSHYKNIPNRIVSLVPSQTELLVDLGLKSKLVGITKFCVHPKNLRKELTTIGGTKQVNINKIKALKPDIILCNKEENTKEIVQELQSIARVEVSDILTFEDALNLIRYYGEVFHVKTKAYQLIATIQANRAKFQQQIADLTVKKVAYFIWENPYMVAANNTFINSMLVESGFQNVFETASRYPEITLENQSLQQADVLLLSSEPFPFKKSHVNAFQKKFPDKKIRIVDGEMFSWYGSRLRLAFDYFEELYR